MKKKDHKALLNQFAYAEHMVACGCPRKDFLDDWEISYLLGEYLTHLINTGQVEEYQSPEEAQC